MKISFGMIFSIILIIIFISFSFSIIKNWLELGTTTQIESFVQYLQIDVNSAWNGAQNSGIEKYDLPDKVEKVCFVDYASPAKGDGINMQEYMDDTYSNSNNLFFYPEKVLKYVKNKEIKNINIEKITIDSNPFCINNIDKKITIVLQKNHDEALVNIVKLE